MEINSLYIHFPFCLKKCNYCDFYSEEDQDYGFYHRLLNDSLEKQQELFELNNVDFFSLDTLYIGGGTPSLWGNRGIDFIGSHLGNSFKLNKKAEFTIEVNPGTDFLEDYKGWKSIGVNRFSIGVQSLNDTFLQYLDRIHTAKEAVEVMKFLQKKKENFSIDLMLGLPFSKEKNRNIIKELKTALAYEPSHISMYLLTVDEDYKYINYLADEDYLVKEYLEASKFLVENGFEHYEISNWAKKGKRSRHNSNYWVPGSWAAVGPSAAGSIQFENKCTRYTWSNTAADYRLEYLTEADLRLERLTMGLRTDAGIRPKDFFEGEDLNRFIAVAQKWRTRKLIRKTDRGVALTDKGFLIFNSMMDDLFNNIKSL